MTDNWDYANGDETVRSLTKIKERVKWLTQKKPCVKGDYNLLIAYYFWYFHGRKFGLPFEEILKLPSSESITRAFRKLVEAGEVQPTGKMALRRASREEAMRTRNEEW